MLDSSCRALELRETVDGGAGVCKRDKILILHIKVKRVISGGTSALLHFLFKGAGMLICLFNLYRCQIFIGA